MFSRGSKRPSRPIVTRSSASFSRISTIPICLLGKRVSEQVVQASWNVAAGASATASLACVPTWYEDFRKDSPALTCLRWSFTAKPTESCPISAAGQRTAKLIKGARLLVVKDGPHCIIWTHADEVNLRAGEVSRRGNRQARRVSALEIIHSGPNTDRMCPSGSRKSAPQFGPAITRGSPLNFTPAFRSAS